MDNVYGWKKGRYFHENGTTVEVLSTTEKTCKYVVYFNNKKKREGVTNRYGINVGHYEYISPSGNFPKTKWKFP